MTDYSLLQRDSTSRAVVCNVRQGYAAHENGVKAGDYIVGIVRDKVLYFCFCLLLSVFLVLLNGMTRCNHLFR